MAEAPAPTVSQFNTSDDAAFQDLLSAHALPAGNALVDVKPSDLNLTRNCWTAFDLFQVAYNNSVLDEISRLSYVKNALQRTLPQNYTGVNFIDTSEYWNTLARLNSTEAVLNGSVEQCKSSRSFTTPAFDFKANCSATGDFWWRNVYNLTIPDSYALDPSWLALFKSSLAPPFQAMSDYTILTICQTIRNRDLRQTNVFPYPLQTTLETAAAECAMPACRSLDYHGNSDIVGAGAVISYGFIAGVSTLLASTILYFRLTQTTGEQPFRKNVKESAVIFWDTIIWFGLLACAGGWAYVSATLYEYVASVLVNNLLLNSAIVLVVMYTTHVENVNRWTRVLPQYGVYFFGASVNWGAYFRIRRNIHFAKNYSDMPCYADGRWPIEYLLNALYIEIAIMAMILLWFVFQISWVFTSKIWKKKKMSWFWKRYIIVLITLATVALWLDFAYIVLIRKRARYGFGSSYQDDSIGYGQVIAAGLAAQAIYAYICAVIALLYRNRKIWKNRKAKGTPASEPKEQDATATATAKVKEALLTVTVQEQPDVNHADLESDDAAGRRSVTSETRDRPEPDPITPNQTLPTRYTF